MKKDTTNDMTVGSPVSLIIKFMIPMCLGNLFQQFYNIADSIVAGKFIGVNALAIMLPCPFTLWLHFPLS